MCVSVCLHVFVCVSICVRVSVSGRQVLHHWQLKTGVLVVTLSGVRCISIPRGCGLSWAVTGQRGLLLLRENTCQNTFQLSPIAEVASACNLTNDFNRSDGLRRILMSLQVVTRVVVLPGE